MNNIQAILLVALLCIIAVQVFPQTIAGVVYDKNIQQPIAYANIGVIGKSVGTVSNEQGQFNLTIPSTLQNDTLKISVIGYEPFVSSIQTLSSTAKDTIYLAKTTYSLQEVVIKPKNLIAKTFGITTATQSVSVGFSGNALGFEGGVLMKNKHKAYLQNIKLHFSSTYDTLFYRINIYKQNGKKNFENILTEPIYFELTKEAITFPVIIDLTSYNLAIEGKFLVTMEIVKDLGEGDLYFSAAPFRKTYGKETSQDLWRTIPVGISISVDALVEK